MRCLNVVSKNNKIDVIRQNYQFSRLLFLFSVFFFVRSDEL